MATYDFVKDIFIFEEKPVYQLSWQAYAFYLVYFFVLFAVSRLVVFSFKKKTWQMEYEEDTNIEIDPEPDKKPKKPIDVIKPETLEKEESNLNHKTKTKAGKKKK